MNMNHLNTLVIKQVAGRILFRAQMYRKSGKKFAFLIRSCWVIIY